MSRRPTPGAARGGFDPQVLEIADRAAGERVGVHHVVRKAEQVPIVRCGRDQRTDGMVGMQDPAPQLVDLGFAHRCAVVSVIGSPHPAPGGAVGRRGVTHDDRGHSIAPLTGEGAPSAGSRRSR